eukprot:CAMPEP_0171235212 /NCGR_PEP_ID=MMETSP0790-20130122/41830_1 /TAXON_ID=2925 /ORGANISM="Alexandrium catenella, Strain OF101" /LENGTH=145 /DNA_ID=CAMNT_0011701517 /DNA_START=13 /DNA_END=448 /DNA_ORIENTATION=-
MGGEPILVAQLGDAEGTLLSLQRQLLSLEWRSMFVEPLVSFYSGASALPLGESVLAHPSLIARVREGAAAKLPSDIGVDHAVCRRCGAGRVKFSCVSAVMNGDRCGAMVSAAGRAACSLWMPCDEADSHQCAQRAVPLLIAGYSL